MKTTTVLAALLAFAATAATNLATAQEVTLKAVTSFAEKTQFSKNFERFIDKVNADGKASSRSTTSAARAPCRRSRSATPSAPR
jgi:hypothetical protein